jgi:gamma-glutamylcyclotransferase (GGCT)/AIG2-like uncharacterized protein YtfP
LKDAAVYGTMRMQNELGDLMVRETIYRRNQCVPQNWSLSSRAAIEQQNQSLQFEIKGELYDIEEAYLEHLFWAAKT